MVAVVLGIGTMTMLVGLVLCTDRVEAWHKQRRKQLTKPKPNPDSILTDQFTGLQYTNAEVVRVYVNHSIERVLSQVDYVVGCMWAKEHGEYWADCLRMSHNADKWRPENLWRWVA